MRCIANVFLKQKAKCILRNVEILISHEVQPFPRNMEDFEICIDKFYEYFMFGRRDITTALEEYTDIFEKYNVTSIVPKRMLLLIFENVVDYLDLIDNPELFNWYYLVAKLILLNLIFEEYSNSITEKKFSYEKIIDTFSKRYSTLFDDKVRSLFDKNYAKLIRNINKNNKMTEKCLRDLNKGPLKVKYWSMGNYNGYDYYISKINFDKKIFDGIDLKHAFDAFQKYDYSIEFKYIEAENVSFEVIKNVFGNKPNTLYFIKLPYNFFRLKTSVNKLVSMIEPKTIKNFVFLIAYDDLINKSSKISEFKSLGFRLGVYNMKEAETKSIKLKGVVDYIYLRPSEVSNYGSLIEFAKSINLTIIENEQNSYKIYK